MTDSASKTKVVRASMYLKRKQGLTQDEFNRYWSEVHGPLVRPLVEKYGILKYTQYHTSTTLQQVNIAAWPELAGMRLIEYDGVAEFIVTDVSVLKKSRDDPFYIEKVRPDEENFFDTQNAAWVVGWEEVYVKDGKIVPDSEVREHAP